MRLTFTPLMINPKQTRNHLPSSQVDPPKKFAWKTAKAECWRNYNMKRPWVSCMTNSSLDVAWQFHHVPSHKRIQLSFAWKQHLVSTDTIWWTPTSVFADDDHPLADGDAHWLLRWCCETELSISLTFPPLCQLKGEKIFSKIYLSSPPSGVGEFQCCTPSFNCMRVPSSVHCWLHYVWL